MLGGVRQMRAAVLHLGDLRVRIVRVEVQSAFEPFFLRVRSNRANSARVGVVRPDVRPAGSETRRSSRPYPAAQCSHRRIGFQRRGTMPTVRPTTSVASASRCNTHVNTAWWVSRSIRRRVRDSVEWSGSLVEGCPETCECSASLQRRATRARSEASPSK